MKKSTIAVIIVVVSILLTSCAGGEAFNQLDLPADGEEIAVIETTMGTVKLRLFPDIAPKAVENFTTHVKDGYYNGQLFYSVDKEYGLLYSGDPTGAGNFGESIWGEPFKAEFSAELRHFRGAVSMVKINESNQHSSRFFFVQAPKLTSNGAGVLAQIEDKLNKEIPLVEYPNANTYDTYLRNTMVEYANERGLTKLTYKQIYPQSVIAEYRKTGGTIEFDFWCTVFAQVFEGLDVLDKIAAAELYGEDGNPLEDIVIISATIEKYAK